MDAKSLFPRSSRASCESCHYSFSNGECSAPIKESFELPRRSVDGTNRQVSWTTLSARVDFLWLTPSASLDPYEC